MLALALLLVTNALEEVPPTRLIYLPGAFASSCPGEVEVQEGIARRLGRTPFGEPPARLVVLALEGDEAGPVRARMELFDAQMESLGARTLESLDGCVELVEAAELAISIALAPALALAPPPVDPPVEPPPPPPPPLVVEEPPPEPEEQPYASWMPQGTRLRFGGGTHGMVNVGPQPTAGVQFTIALRLGSFELALEQKQELPRWDGELEIVHGAGINTLMGCGEWTWMRDDEGAFGWIGCLTGSTGSPWSLGRYIGGGPYFGLGARLGPSWTMWDGAVLRLWGQLEGAVIRTRFAAFDGTLFWEQELPFTVVGGFTYEVAWP